MVHSQASLDEAADYLFSSFFVFCKLLKYCNSAITLKHVCNFTDKSRRMKESKNFQ